MRDILFRGKKLFDGTWVYGYFTVGDSDNLSRIIYKTSEGSIAKPVFDKSVGQYTGLTDKNGRKVFEGDIVKYSADGEDSFYQVYYKEGSIRFGKYGDIFSQEDAGEDEIVGNVFDNPELLAPSVE